MSSQGTLLGLWEATTEFFLHMSYSEQVTTPTPTPRTFFTHHYKALIHLENSITM
jgi:hypothetical protein